MKYKKKLEQNMAMVVKGKLLRLTQAIQVPEKMSATLFDLECVKSAIKYDDKVYYIIIGPIKTRMIAEPGSWLCQRKDGNWEVITNEKYQKYYAK